MAIEAEQLGELLDRYWPVLVAWIGGPRDEAEDAAQAAFIKLSTEDPMPENCRAWLFTVTKRIATNERIARRKRTAREQEAVLKRPRINDRQPPCDRQAAMDCLLNSTSDKEKSSSQRFGVNSRLRKLLLWLVNPKPRFGGRIRPGLQFCETYTGVIKMDELNDESFPSQQADMIAFEQQLRQHSLGDGPAHRDTILFQCGYAAGVAATQNLNRLRIRRWKAVGIAASLAACVSLTLHTTLGLNEGNQPMERESMAQETTGDPFNSWGELLVNAQEVSPQNNRRLTTAGDYLLDQQDDVGPMNIPQDVSSNGAVLQPSDFIFFLNGDAKS